MNRSKKPHTKEQRKNIDKAVHRAQMTPETPSLNPSSSITGKPSAGSKKMPHHKVSKRTSTDQTEPSQLFRKKH